MMKSRQSKGCQIKDILYPEPKRPSKNFIPNNYKKIKIIEEQNRLKKAKKESHVERKFSNILILFFL